MGLRKIVTAWRSAAGARSFGTVADGKDGTNGTNGTNGVNGWTPILAPEQDGTRTLLKVMDWAGGSGAKPATGMYLSTSGYVDLKANAFNFNTAKKFGIFSAVSNAQGIATINFGSMFAESAAAPTIAYFGIPATAVGGVKVSLVAGTLSKTGVQIKVEAPSLLGTVLTVLAGATVFVFAAEQ